MNTRLRTTLAATVLVALVPETIAAQATHGADALARATLIEQQEGDLKAAEAAYRALLDAQPAQVQAEAALRLGTLLWRLDRKHDAEPLLERAVAQGGDVAARATAVLQGQDEAGRQQGERLARARSLVERVLLLTPDRDDGSGELQATENELVWLGDAAATALGDRLRSLRSDMLNRARMASLPFAPQAPPQPTQQTRLAGLLWRVGTPPAQAFFTEVASDLSPEWRLCMVTECGRAADDLLPTALAFLRDKDPTGEVPRKVLVLAGRWSVPDLERLLADAAPTARAGGLDGLRLRWPGLGADERDAVLAKITSQVRAAVRESDPLVARSACRLLQAFAEHGPRAGRDLWLAELPQYPSGLRQEVDHKVAEGIALDDDEMQLALAAGRALQHSEDRSRGVARAELEVLLALHQPAWSARSVDALLELIELDYCGYQGTDPQWLARFFALAQPAQLVRFVRALPHLPLVKQALQQLAAMDLPQALFPALRDVIDQVLATPPPTWRVTTRAPFRRGGVKVEVSAPDRDLQSLLSIVARTGSPEAPPWLSQFVDRLPAAAEHVAGALPELSRAGVGEPARVAMRRLLVWEGTPEVELSDAARSMLFAELARVGDVPAIALYARAYALGLARTPNRELAVEVLAQPRSPGDTQVSQPRGYTDTQLVEVWRSLLASPAKDAVWGDLLMAKSTPPTLVLPLIAPALPTRWPADARQRNAWWNLLSAFGRVTVDELAADPTLRASIGTLLRAPQPELAWSVLVQLRPDVCAQFASQARDLMRTAANPESLRPTLRRAGIELSTDDWLLILRRATGNNLTTAFAALPLPCPPALVREVEGMLGNEDADVRAAACTALARLQSIDSVAPLLQALRDPADIVRTAATTALQSIRFQQEQQAFWANAKSGIDVSAASATAKLLLQAKPGEAKDQRLLAIRSLAVLGTAEALPYLIDWTKDADAEIAAAARAAVASIHSAAEARK
ncbi:MAG TPA: HEAT repeat domain-containing protein [Planctomycetota bacterium]|nr:HEAT repeat domain-containing protein [Planctomycetota bacterium]